MQKVTSKAILIILIVITTTQFSSLLGTVNAAGGSDAEFDVVVAVLSKIETGRTALSQMEQYDVEVKFDTDGGSYYRASDNRIVIDGTQGALRAALSFVHEITHARYHNEGKRADIGQVDQELYVVARIEEEADGVFSSLKAKKEMAEAGFDVSQMRYPLEKAYTEAHLTAQNAARARERDITSVELDSIGQAAGMARVIQGFMNGEVRGSKNKSTYTEYYSDCWRTADTLTGLVTAVGKVISAEAAAKLLQSASDYASSSC